MAVSQIDNNGVNLGQLGNRSLIINGAMTVAQRGTSGSSASTNNFLLDRFSLSRFGGYPDNATQSQESDAPSGHYKSFKMLRNSAHTLTGTNASALYQIIEGQNMAHLNWGTSNAQSVTLSFWVKSNKTGDFPFIVSDSVNAYDNGNLYTISAANTWEYKSISIEGPTAGTFGTGNTTGMILYWGFGAVDASRTAQGTTWGVSNSSGSSKAMVTGASTALATDSGATWQITGVQLEQGDTATPFEHPRSYGDELARCQRYYYELGGSSYYPYFLSAVMNSALVRCVHQHPVPMRASPALSTTNPTAIDVEGISATSLTIDIMTTITAMLNINVSTSFAVRDCVRVYNNASGISKIHFDAEL